MGTVVVHMLIRAFKLKNKVSKEYGYKSWVHARIKAPYDEKICILLDVIQRLTETEE